MSPELMQEKAYDTKSDIWSLGCLLYELCALKYVISSCQKEAVIKLLPRPPFHEAKTHNELSLFIRNGRIPPLPRGYSNALTQVIKSMLNINVCLLHGSNFSSNCSDIVTARDAAICSTIVAA